MKLSLLETRELIERYHSELRKLEFQIAKTRMTVDELESSLGSFESAGPAKKKGRPAKTKIRAKLANVGVATQTKASKRGRPAKKAKAVVKKTATGKRGRPKVVTVWDDLVLGMLNGAKEPVKSKEFLEAARKNKAVSRGMNEAAIRAKINASLQKLVNKLKSVKKVPAEGRGYAYKLV